MTPLRVLVVDDELLARRRMLRLLSDCEGITVVGEASDAAQALLLLREEPVDLVFLDIQMPGLTGIQASELIDPDAITVVFVTAHPEHAVAAFGVGAADYLLKPVDGPRLETALARVRERRGTLPDPSTHRLALPTRKGIRLVDPGTVRSAIFDGSLLAVHLPEERLFVDWTVRALEERLPQPPFLRVHRRALVNLDHVSLLEPTDAGGYIAHLDAGPPIQVSRQVARGLRRDLGVSRGS